MLGYQVGRDDDGGFDGATAVVIATHGGAEAETIRAALDAGSATSVWWRAESAGPRCSTS